MFLLFLCRTYFMALELVLPFIETQQNIASNLNFQLSQGSAVTCLGLVVMLQLFIGIFTDVPAVKEF